MTERVIDEYIPYEATAKVIARGEESNENFLRSLVPDATDEQIDKFVHFVAGKIHDGIEYGLALSVADPVGALEAYRMGDTEGYARAYEEIERRNM